MHQIWVSKAPNKIMFQEKKFFPMEIQSVFYVRTMKII